MTDFYIKNLSWIQARDGQLYFELLNMVEPRPDVDWYTVDTMMRPKEWLFGLGPFSPSATIVLYGFGDGEHALHVLERLGERGHLILVVCDVSEFLEMLHIADMEPLLSDGRLHLVVLGINNDIVLRHMAGCLTPETVPLARIISLPGYDKWYPEGRQFIEQAFKIVRTWVKS